MKSSAASPSSRAWKMFWKQPGSLLLATTLLLVIASALLAPILPLESPDRQFTHAAYSTPSWSADLGEGGFFINGHPLTERVLDDLWPWDRALYQLRLALFGERVWPPWLGRDSLGRCVQSRILWGARVSLAVATVAGLVSLLVGVSYGMVSGYFGGRIDDVMMRVLDALYSVPFIFIVIFVITLLRATSAGSGSNLLVFFVVMGLVYWLTMARVVRGQVLSLKQQEFVEAARALGVPAWRILLTHMVPNLLPVVIVTLTLTLPRVMLFEAFLSFLGLGVEAPDVSWGLLVREAFEVMNPVRAMWWMVLWPSVFLAGTLAALNGLGDRLRDALDPRLRG